MRENRRYKRGEPFRDAVKIVIITEGEKEQKYFTHLNYLLHSRRFTILPFPPEADRSAPNFAQERIKKVIMDERLRANDSIWLVFDIDNWEETVLVSLSKITNIKGISVNLLLSNPCFEVWLWAHDYPVDDIRSKSCTELKKELHDKTKTGFNLTEFNLSQVRNAYWQCKKKLRQEYWKPDLKSSTIFKLIEYLSSLSGGEFEL